MILRIQMILRIHHIVCIPNLEIAYSSIPRIPLHHPEINELLLKGQTWFECHVANLGDPAEKSMFSDG